MLDSIYFSTSVNFGSTDNDLKVQFFKGNLRATVSFLTPSYPTSFVQGLFVSPAS